MRIGVDTGGTFTDVVTPAGQILKVPSTPTDPGAAVRAGVAAVADGGGLSVLAHGTTVATNALLQRRGARVVLVATKGFGDVIEIGRQDRPSLYDQWVDRPTPLVARSARLEVTGRLDAAGREVEELDPVALAELGTALEVLREAPGGPGAVAVCLLHSDLNPVHELATARWLAAFDPNLDVSCSHEVSPQFREFERMVTTVINAYLRPTCRSYLEGLAAVAPTVLVMTSAGGLVPIHDGASEPARLLLSGPAGGVIAAAAVTAANGYPDAITFDMGGTSTDVCLVLDGQAEPAGERSVGGFPVRLPALDIHTIGAGGGSIASLDPGGALIVGPESAGAVPGPACYGHGGSRPTVTDADLVAGRLPTDVEFPGIGRLDRRAAEVALDAAEVNAEGVIAVVEASMEQALRAVSVARGVDPRGLALVAFGGAGPVHACGLADALGMPIVIIPPRAGVLSAVGLMCGPRQRDLVRSWPTPADHGDLPAALVSLGQEAASGLEGEVELTLGIDCRYAGQSHELTVETLEAFAAEHRRRNGFDLPGSPVEVVALRATARVHASIAVGDLPNLPEEQLFGRDGASSLVGPSVIARPDCSIFIPAGWYGEAGAAGALLLRRLEPGADPR